MQQQRHSDVMR